MKWNISGFEKELKRTTERTKEQDKTSKTSSNGVNKGSDEARKTWHETGNDQKRLAILKEALITQ